jgi:hypothetical protein
VVLIGPMVETSTHLHTSKQVAISKDHVLTNLIVLVASTIRIVQIPGDVLQKEIVNS